MIEVGDKIKFIGDGNPEDKNSPAHYHDHKVEKLTEYFLADHFPFAIFAWVSCKDSKNRPCAGSKMLRFDEWKVIDSKEQ